MTNSVAAVARASANAASAQVSVAAKGAMVREAAAMIFATMWHEKSSQSTVPGGKIC